jgi:hypothetical protein
LSAAYTPVHLHFPNPTEILAAGITDLSDFRVDMAHAIIPTEGEIINLIDVMYPNGGTAYFRVASRLHVMNTKGQHAITLFLDLLNAHAS